ncbi:hypothetical protein [Streptomyces actuosus]|uniref:hypothetical protein n=1 Tax=Streptomyces actuosus TaxID=1885 RepID=UPI001F06ACBA|nr:hypothetical protein [Streptomyces actuosus]
MGAVRGRGGPRAFLRAAGTAARIGCVIVDEGDGAEEFARYDAVPRKVADCRPVPPPVPLGERFEPGAAADVDGLLVCGGLTPAYVGAFAGCREQTHRLLGERGVPCPGFSTGAVVAAADAVARGGGWTGSRCARGTPPRSRGEVEVRPGLGLVPFEVDVRPAQWGTLGRLVAAVASGRVPRGLALDEDTVVEVPVDGAPVRVAGLGRAHLVRSAAEGGAVVRSYTAGESFTVPQATARSV